MKFISNLKHNLKKKNVHTITAYVPILYKVNTARAYTVSVQNTLMRKTSLNGH